MAAKQTVTSSNIKLPADKAEAIYTTMRRIRAFEERTVELFEQGAVKGTAHSYIGEEAVAAAVSANLRDDDYMASNHRGHGHCIAKGADQNLMMAELMGRETGYCRGLGGSMHIADMRLNIMGANGIVGATMPLATGAALAVKLRGGDQVVVAFFGDGASNQGTFHECANLANIWDLPILFICENNQYALTTPYRYACSVERISDRAGGYGMPGITIDGNDAGEIYAVVGEAVERARAGQGPSLIECMTYRWGQHSMRSNLRDPRPKEEYDSWIARDPIKLLEQRLTSEKTVSKKRMKEIGEQVVEDLEAAVAFGDEGAEPTVDIMLDAVYAPHADYDEPGAVGDRELNYIQALNEALAGELERDERVFVMGEDVGETGGIFSVTKGLYERFGAERMRDTPITEVGFTGAGVGAAIAGMRPVVEIQIFDFVALTMDMLVNQAAKFRYMLGGRPTVPLVVRGPQGGGIRLAAQHSQSLEAWFTHVPGLVVMAPSTPYDAKGMLCAAIRDDNPVIFLEHKMLYMEAKGPVPEGEYAIPIGKADIKRQGTDITVVATLAMVPRVLSVAQQLEREGISVEVVDPRTLRPLDEETILNSVRKTSRLVIAHEAWKNGGFGAEVAAMVVEKAFDHLDAPIVRVGGLDVPMPYNDALERATIPSQERIAEAIRETVQGG
ncbi:MAG: dehydrogenase E1 component subunit alpha/beta [Alphaproteobacteria bacterium]|jgi:2-oxoisovalerate dehydrogenase E1 component|nr:dehydrogenase E1 component subunit alpha/beta [Alphaproteobacteria bacterium]MDP6563592.1 dehydrogenase E1 component subunit alpha/beta [Alphaproteobacteria bacterium]MDP6814259.1 dehydrogenase E1 component subunit alpha/beta [Alphaproteobacteria bacterium]